MNYFGYILGGPTLAFIILMVLESDWLSNLRSVSTTPQDRERWYVVRGWIAVAVAIVWYAVSWRWM